MSQQRAAMLPTKAQQQAIEAKLNFVLGADTYDRWFLGFACGGLTDDTVEVFVSGCEGSSSSQKSKREKGERNEN